MATPESKVKAKIKKLLALYECYYFMPIGGQFSTYGVPDIVGCLQGVFFGIECKANGGKATALQMKHLHDIAKSGGVSVLIDESGFDKLKGVLDTMQPAYYDLTKQGEGVEKKQKATRERV